MRASCYWIQRNFTAGHWPVHVRRNWRRRGRRGRGCNGCGLRHHFLYTATRIRINFDVTGFGCASYVASEIESGDRNWYFADPTPCRLSSLLLERDTLSCSNQRVRLRKAKPNVVVRHCDAAVRVPRAARTHIEQSTACVGKHVS